MKAIIKKWYDSYFEKLLSETELTPCTIDDYKSTKDYKMDLLMSLYFCESTAKKAKEQGLTYDVILDTFSDITKRVCAFVRENNELGMYGHEWTTLAHGLNLHKLGRLEFMPSADKMEVHIPAGEPFDTDACVDSFLKSVDFFDRYHPDFKYDTYSVDTWLLDDTLVRFLDKDSNILRFARLFDKKNKTESDDAIRFVFGWNATRENLSKFEIKNSFMQKLYDYITDGGKLYRVYGEIKKDDIVNGRLELR